MKITSIGDRIAEARKKAGLSQAQVAEKTGYSTNTICRLEKSHSVADANQITKIGDLVGCDLIWLLTGRGGGELEQHNSIPVFQTVNSALPSVRDAIGYLNYPDLAEGDFAIVNNSPSMEPRISEGCYMIVKNGVVEDGQVAAIIDEWGALQVRFQRRVDGSVFYVPEDPRYSTISEEKATLIGRIVSTVQVNTY